MADKKHILLITQYFYPEPFRINDIAQEWIKRGYKVTVLTGIPNYPEGRFYPGYSWHKKRQETWSGIDIIRIPLISRGTSAIRLVLNYFSFVFSGFFWSHFTKLKADLVFTFEVSPMTQAKIGIWYARRRKISSYLYVQDLWPENVITVTGISHPLVIRPIDRMVDRIYRNTDMIFAASPGFVKAICGRKAPVDPTKVRYWPQYAEEFYHPCERRHVSAIPDDGSFKVIFTGNIGTAQGLQILPAAAELLKGENIKFVMVGDGRYLSEFDREVKKRGVEDQFLMIPRQDPESIPALLCACDAAFLSFQDDPLWTKTIPAKLQSYMACGMPVIAAAQGETERIIREAGCGVCSAIGDSRALSEKIREIRNADLTAMGKRSRAYFEQHFDKKMLMDQMDEYFR